jgi:hypothetical protein
MGRFYRIDTRDTVRSQERRQPIDRCDVGGVTVGDDAEIAAQLRRGAGQQHGAGHFSARRFAIAALRASP